MEVSSSCHVASLLAWHKNPKDATTPRTAFRSTYEELRPTSSEVPSHFVLRGPRNIDASMEALVSAPVRPPILLRSLKPCGSRSAARLNAKPANPLMVSMRPWESGGTSTETINPDTQS
jgi:hypothetical protein